MAERMSTRIRYDRIRDKSAVSRTKNGHLKRKERANRDERMAGLIKTGKVPYTPAVRSWISGRLDKLFTREREYKTWMNLGYEDKDTIGLIEPEWNDFDKLTDKTKMIHNTRRRTQPWKAGLPVDFIPAENNPLNPLMLLSRLRRKLFGEYAMLGQYKAHPDQRQEQTAGTGPLGEEMWNATCAKCHGPSGEGDYGPKIAGTALVSDPQAVEQVLRNGFGTMPPVGRDWTDDEMTAITTYLKENLGG